MRRALLAAVLLGACSGGDGRADAASADAPDTPDASDTQVDAGADANAGPTPWLMGYYPGYQRDLLPPDQITWSSLTHIAIGRVTPNADGTLNTTFDIDPTNGPALAHDLIDRARAANVKSILMIGGAGEHAGWVGAASGANRAAFVANLVQLRTDYAADGLDLDWEPVDAADQPDLLALAQDLRAADPGAILTIPVGWLNANFPDVDPFWADLAAEVDQMNIMTYGMSGAWAGWLTWYSSALDGETGQQPSSVQSSVAGYLAAGIPPGKLGVGAGFYGTCWSGAVAPGASTAGATIVADDNVMSYTAIAATYYDPAAFHYDSTAEAPWLGFAVPQGPEGCMYISYEDAQSVAAKGSWVKANGLGGVIVWTINEGHVGMTDPLLDALHGSLFP